MRTSLLLSLAIALPISALAATDSTVSSKLSNQTQYTLEQVATWGNNCVVDKNNLAKILAPGESTTLKVKNDCDWAGVRYKVVSNKQTLAYVGYAFRDNVFTWDVTTSCENDGCAFTGLPQAKETKK